MAPMTWPTPAADALLASLGEGIDLALPQALALRRELHRHPDLGGAELPTADRLRRALPGLSPTRVAETGFLVRLGPAEGPAIALRAELDALPIVEETGVGWASTNGSMHACGHDIHMAALWLLLQAVLRVEGELPVGVVGVFQPREEVQPRGGEDVVESGLLQRHQVRSVVGVHVQPRVPQGYVSTGIGAVNAAADSFDIVVHGQPGHGAYPHITIDPIPILASIVLGLQELVGRTVDPIRPALISVGRIEAGATHNVIPATGSLQGIIRTMDRRDQDHLHESVRRLADHAARARGATAQVSIVKGDPVLSNDARLVQLTDPLLARAGLLVAEDPFRSLGADDFSHYSGIAPILMMFVGTGNRPAAEGRHQVGLHHPRFLPEDSALRRTALGYAAGLVGATQAAASAQANAIRSA